MRVLGVDPSYAATGLALADTGVMTVEAPKSLGHDVVRAEALADQVLEATRDVDLVVIEAPSHGSAFNGARLGGLAYVIRAALWRHDVPFLDVTPAQLKKYATGRGNAGKGLVLVEAVKRLGYTGSDDNVADALWLRQIGLRLLGEQHVDVPAKHAEALKRLDLGGVVVQHPAPRLVERMTTETVRG